MRTWTTRPLRHILSGLMQAEIDLAWDQLGKPFGPGMSPARGEALSFKAAA
jgi:hypothetical protein